MRIKATQSISLLVIMLLISLLLLSGFITNFLSFTSKSLSTLLIDFLIFFFFGHTIVTLAWRYYNNIPVKLDYFLFTLFWLALLVISILKVLFIDTNPLGERLLGLRNNLLYSSFVLYIPLLFQADKRSKIIIDLILSLGIFLCLFSFLQFIFSRKLPLSLLALKGEGAFSFLNEDFVRPTALVGNTIIFSSFTLILFCLFLIRYLRTKNILYLLFTGIAITANVLTYTRAALVGLAICGGIVLLLYYGRFSLSFILKCLAALSIFVVSVLLIGYHYRDSFIVRRVTGTEASTVYSTRDHFNEIDASIAYLKKKPWVGTGIGTQGPGGNMEYKIITDGFWFQLFLENGLLLGAIYLLFYLASFFYALLTLYSAKEYFLQELCIAFIAFSVYFYLANFINSAFIGRINQIVFWIIFSLLLTQKLLEKERRNAYASN